MILDAATRAELQRDMVQLADGDRLAFEPVFARLWPLLRQLASRHLPAADAEDAAQRALLRVFERAAEFDPSRDALAWVVGLTIWEVRSARRQHWRRRQTVPLDEATAEIRAGAPGPEELAIADDLAAMLGQSLASLRPTDAEALMRAARGERPAGAAFRKRLQRARERLQMAWRRHHA